MDLKVRPAQVEDAEQIAQIQVNSYRTAYGPLLPAEYLAHFSVEEQTADWEELIPSDSSAIHLVAEDSLGCMSGYAYGRRRTFGDYDCELIALHVSDDVRYLGVGKRLFVETVRRFHTQGCKALYLWVLDGNPALEFYIKLGGTFIGRKPWGNNKYFGVEVMELAVGWPDLGALL